MTTWLWGLSNDGPLSPPMAKAKKTGGPPGTFRGFRGSQCLSSLKMKPRNPFVSRAICTSSACSRVGYLPTRTT